MIEFGMPTLIETARVEDCAALCRDVGMQFVEMNMNLPQYQVQVMDSARLKKTARDYGIFYTIHLDENMNIADFNPYVTDAYIRTVRETIRLAKELEIPVLNMHMPLGVYFTLPERKVYLLGEYPDQFRDNALRFRDACTEEIGDSGVKICMENWAGFTPWQIPVIDALLESPAFGLTFDVGHNFCKQGVDEPVILARKKKLMHMHLHDVKNGTQDHQALGTGELDIDACLKLAGECGCRVVVEAKTITGLKASAQWLNKKDLL